MSKSTGMNYYFNRFTGAKTWELSDILPGHSSGPANDAGPGTLNQPITVRDSHHQQGQNTGQRHLQPPLSQGERLHPPISTQSLRRPPQLPDFGHHQPRQTVLTSGVADQVASMEVEELEELLVQQKKKLREMAERQIVANEDSSSVESGFMSLAGREEEGGLVPDIWIRVRRRFSGRQS